MPAGFRSLKERVLNLVRKKTSDKNITRTKHLQRLNLSLQIIICKIQGNDYFASIYDINDYISNYKNDLPPSSPIKKFYE